MTSKRILSATLWLAGFSQVPIQAKKSLQQRLHWSLQLPNVEENGSPAKHNGIVTSTDGKSLWMTTQKGFLYGVDAADGSLIVKHQPYPWTKMTESKPVLCEKTDANGESSVEYVVYAISDGRVIAVNTSDGLERWMMYSEYCTPTQPMISHDCSKVYYTCNKRHINESELFVVNDEESRKNFMGMPEDQVTRQGEKLGPVSVGAQATRSTGNMYLYFGSYQEDDTNTTSAVKERSSFNQVVGHTIRYNALDRSLEELSVVEDGVKAPVGLSRDEKLLWASTYDPNTKETTLHGMTALTGQLRGARIANQSIWSRSLGMTSEHLNHAPIKTRDEQSLFVATEKSVHKISAKDGTVQWNVPDLNIKAMPVLHPGLLDSNGQRRLTDAAESTTLYVMEDTGGRVWKVDTATGDMELEANCIDSATCAMASHADFATSPDGTMLYIALNSGLVYALETTQPFAASSANLDGPPTEAEPSEDANAKNPSTNPESAAFSTGNLVSISFSVVSSIAIIIFLSF